MAVQPRQWTRLVQLAPMVRVQDHDPGDDDNQSYYDADHRFRHGSLHPVPLHLKSLGYLGKNRRAAAPAAHDFLLFAGVQGLEQRQAVLQMPVFDDAAALDAVEVERLKIDCLAGASDGLELTGA
jgi:hypothetical protein